MDLLVSKIPVFLIQANACIKKTGMNPKVQTN